VLEVFDILDIEIVDPQPHTHIFAVDRGHHLSPFCLVIPAKAGIQGRPFRRPPWTPAFRGGDE
jgi:hypothetical protein